MIAALLARFGLKIGSTGLIAIVVAAMLAAGGFAFWRGLSRIEAMVETARVEAIAARDAKWQAEIARANAAVEKARAAQLAAVIETERRAAAAIAEAEEEIARLEQENAELPNGSDLAFDRDHVRLLPR